MTGEFRLNVSRDDGGPILTQDIARVLSSIHFIVEGRASGEEEISFSNSATGEHVVYLAKWETDA